MLTQESVRYMNRDIRSEFDSDRGEMPSVRRRRRRGKASVAPCPADEDRALPAGQRIPPAEPQLVSEGSAVRDAGDAPSTVRGHPLRGRACRARRPENAVLVLPPLSWPWGRRLLYFYRIDTTAHNTLAYSSRNQSTLSLCDARFRSPVCRTNPSHRNLQKMMPG